MKVYLSKTEAVDRLVADEFASWSYEGAEALVDYLEALEEDLGEDFYFDPIALRCDFSEYASREEAAEDTGIDPEELDVIAEFQNGVIIRNY